MDSVVIFTTSLSFVPYTACASQPSCRPVGRCVTPCFSRNHLSWQTVQLHLSLYSKSGSFKPRKIQLTWTLDANSLFAQCFFLLQFRPLDLEGIFLQSPIGWARCRHRCCSSKTCAHVRKLIGQGVAHVSRVPPVPSVSSDVTSSLQLSTCDTEALLSLCSHTPRTSHR